MVLGSDVAGEVAEVGQAVTRFRVGDRVLGHAVGSDKDSNSAAEGGFQQYTVVLERMAAPIPDAMPFEDAALLARRIAACPAAVKVAACFAQLRVELHAGPFRQILTLRRMRAADARISSTFNHRVDWWIIYGLEFFQPLS